VSRRGDAQADLGPADGQDGNTNVAADDDLFSKPAGQNQHDVVSLTGSANFPSELQSRTGQMTQGHEGKARPKATAAFRLKIPTL